MAKNGLLNRLQRRLLLLAAASRSVRTRQLAELVAKAVRTREPGQDPATRTFQALRIHVNRELEEVSLMLPQAAGAPRAGRAARRDQLPFAGRPHRQALPAARVAPGSAPRDCRCAPARCHNRRSSCRTRGSARPRRKQEETRGRAAPSCGWPSAPRAPSTCSQPNPNRARRAVAKLNLLLLAVLVACALGLVTSQHKARKLFSDLEREQQPRARARHRVRPLQLEASTWGLHRASSASRSARSACARPIRAAVRLVARDPGR